MSVKAIPTVLNHRVIVDDQKKEILGTLRDDSIQVHEWLQGYTVRGLTGNDAIETWGANQFVYGGAGTDTIQVHGENSIVYGGTGNDSIQADEGAITAYGEAGDDVIRGGSLGDGLNGGDGNDVLIGMQGADTLMGGPGFDYLVGGINDMRIVLDPVDPPSIRWQLKDPDWYLTHEDPDGYPDRFVFPYGVDHGRDVIMGFSPSDGDKLVIGRDWRVDVIDAPYIGAPLGDDRPSSTPSIRVILSGDESHSLIDIPFPGGLKGLGSYDWFVWM